jgi:hypothetical protein
MKTFLCVLVLAALAGAGTADDVSGKWSGSFNATNPNGETKESTATFVFKQSGTDITGTVGPDESDQVAIQKGKIEGKNITLEAEHQGNILKFALVLVAADRITGEAQMVREGQTEKAKIDVTRSK